MVRQALRALQPDCLCPRQPGAVTASLRVGVLGDWSRSDWTVGSAARTRSFGRQEANLLATMELPVTSGAYGTLTASFSGPLREVSRAGNLPGYSYGLEWAPDDSLSIEGTIEHQRLPMSRNRSALRTSVTSALD